MAFEIANPVGSGTDQELLDFTRAAIAQVTLHGQMYTTSGRTLTRADLPALHKQLLMFEARVNVAAGQNGANIACLRRAV